MRATAWPKRKPPWRKKTRLVARATDDYVHDNPWRSIGIAAGIGLVIGLLIGRR
ncbi:MAG: hypothetical protein M5R42_10755 [Rhodocyclaceae bacterium]|nr:hypothetical protein [Rhodocyclaceae bacterium]